MKRRSQNPDFRGLNRTAAMRALAVLRSECPLFMVVCGFAFVTPARADSDALVSESAEVVTLAVELPGEETAALLDENEQPRRPLAQARDWLTSSGALSESDLADVSIEPAEAGESAVVLPLSSRTVEHEIAALARDERPVRKGKETKTAQALRTVRVGPSASEINDVPYEILLSARNSFRRLVGGAAGGSVPEERYVGSLLSPLSPNAPLFPGDAGSAFALPLDPRGVVDTDDDPATLDADKVYTVVDGRIVEVAQVDAPLLSPYTPVRPPAGFLISVEQGGEKSFVTPKDSKETKTGPLAAAAPSAPAASASRRFELADTSGLESLAVSTNASPSGSDRRFEIPMGELSADSLSLDSSGPTDPASGAEAARLVNVRGHVTLPQGVKPESVVLQIAGTGLQVHPGADGAFELREMPVGSRFEILVWDMNNVLTRRIVPATAVEGEEHPIALERAAFVDNMSAAFGVRQSLTQSGFCARLKAPASDMLIGARVTVRASQDWQGPFYFNENHLPDTALAEASRDGRFCVFNARSPLVDVDVVLLGGARRSFTVHLIASTFEPDLVFDMGASTYRPVMPLELVDAAEAFDSSRAQKPMRFGTLSTRRWLSGDESATWARVYGLRLRADAAYASVNYDESDEAERRYFPVAQEWQEVRFARDEEGAPESFALVSRAALMGEGHGSKSAGAVLREAIALPVMDSDTLEDMARSALGFDADPKAGTAFVSLDLAALGLEWSDVKLSLRDAWTGKGVAPFHFVPVAPGVKNPRQLRGFFTDIPEGQFTLLVTDKGGALKWIDVVRSRAGSMQVLSVRE